MAKHTLDELYQWQALPLSIKQRMSLTRIRAWINEYGEDGVYISYSGGKDSTVLSYLVDEAFPGNKIERVFVDTGLEYPEIRDFVRKESRAVFLKPKMNFKQVIEKYGYPFISKEISQTIYEVVHPKRQGKDVTNYKAYKKLMGENGKKDFLNREKYRFFLEDGAPVISNRCCAVMKKEPAKRYEKETGKHPITGQMASESKVRTQRWLQVGCNGFDLKRPVSNPLSFWTNQDILLFIKLHNIEICSVYGDIVTDYAKEGQINGQLSLTDLSDEYGLFDLGNPPLTTTGCKRTGCMFCGYGCHNDKPGEERFVRMRETHPRVWDYIMRPKEQGGLNYKEVIDWINEHGNLNIKY